MILTILSTEGLSQSSPEVDIAADQFLCTMNFTPVLQGIGAANIKYHWDFGDGVTDESKMPVHQYRREGKFKVNLTITYSDSTVEKSISATRTIRFRPDRKLAFTEKKITVRQKQYEGIVDAEIYTYTDQASGHMHRGKSPNNFLNGNSGIWKREAVYRYDAPRMEGLYSITLPERNADITTSDKWIATEQALRLSHTNQPLESINADGVPSATLMDEDQRNIIAFGTNMRLDEAAFTSFEGMSLNTGNWIFGNGEQLNTNTRFDVISGYKNFMLVEPNSHAIENFDSVNVWATPVSGLGQTIFVSVPVVCQQPYERNKTWSALILGDMPYDGLWTGYAYSANTIQPSVHGVSHDNRVSHSGTSSIRVTGSPSIRQVLLSLSPSKKYVLSAWVSTAASRTRNSTVAGTAIEVIMSETRGQSVVRAKFFPSGPVIEGWQQIHGVFETPKHPSELTLTLVTGDISWYDDLRLYPDEGNMKAFVYDKVHGKKAAVLDENNRATYYYYAPDGALHQEKKETDEGVKTTLEIIQYTRAYND